MGLLTLSEAAKRAGVARMTVWLWIRDGRIRSRRCTFPKRGWRRRGFTLQVPVEDVDQQAARIKAQGPTGPGSKAKRAALAAEAARANQVAA